MDNNRTNYLRAKGSYTKSLAQKKKNINEVEIKKADYLAYKNKKMTMADLMMKYRATRGAIQGEINLMKDHEKNNPKVFATMGESYEIGTKEYTNHTKKMTPGQSEARQRNDGDEEMEHIVMQLRKSVSMRGQKEVKFADGSKAKISVADATKAMKMIDNLRMANAKQMLTRRLGKSHQEFKDALAGKEKKKDPFAIKIRSRMEEKTLTKAELKKREEVAKAIEKDNPDMPMDKKMAIATATAKRVAEEKEADYPHAMYDPKTGKKVMAKSPADHSKYAEMGYTHEEPDMNEISSTTLSNYMRKSAADAGKPGASARRQDKRIGGQKTADEKIRKRMGYGSSAKVAAGPSKNESKDFFDLRNHLNEAKASKDQAMKFANELEVYANKYGGIDKKDLMTISKKVKMTGKLPSKAVVDDNDTDVRELLYMMMFNIMGDKYMEKQYKVRMR
ncbi:MAG: hypothetical protein CBB72_011840 [Muricauda sp. TMED12]|nr:MAG: hypothetical protein CBB72_011840 [Muricauda sp. TMED12]